MEPRHLIAMSLGKIQVCRGKRGGPSLHKSLMVSAILYKARNILMNDIYIQARKVEMYEEEKQRMMAEREQQQQQNGEISDMIEPPRPETPLPTEETASHAIDAAKESLKENTCDKENTPPTPANTEAAPSQTHLKAEESSNMECRETTDLNKCAKRRLSETSDSENIPPKRSRSENPATESTDNNNVNASSQGQECSQQISCLVQRFNSGLNGLFAQKCNSGPLQDSQGHNDVVSNCCATQLTKDSTFSEQISRPVIALTV